LSGRIEAAEIEAARARVAEVSARIAAACGSAGRDPAEVTVVGACKRQPVARIAASVIAGLRELGENYVQEARDVRPAVDALVATHDVAPPRWRMIGHLQRNKAGQAVELFDAIDTVDRAKLAVALDKRAASREAPLDVCLQIDLSGEAGKSGARPEDAPALLEACAGLAHLRVVGLMTMPEADPGQARAAFARLRALRDTLRDAPGGEHLVELSMGMSGDYEAAVEEGATRVRIGTALFGERAAPATGTGGAGGATGNGGDGAEGGA